MFQHRGEMHNLINSLFKTTAIVSPHEGVYIAQFGYHNAWMFCAICVRYVALFITVNTLLQ